MNWRRLNAVPTAGKTTIERLQEMLGDAAFAFLVLTGEDKRAGAEAMQARLNVVHEASSRLTSASKSTRANKPRLSPPHNGATLDPSEFVQALDKCIGPCAG
jgi:hypothetical protein